MTLEYTLADIKIREITGPCGSGPVVSLFLLQTVFIYLQIYILLLQERNEVKIVSSEWISLL